ncbi:molybdopterin-dependent oxidoreductase [Pyrofollis japonicus]|uniref:molybdopterin-dependent oxidoreductase n=1 Tax=Pyrofollis japonicus TaxID=3060460 RepID=UPI00295A8147|nr:molybdopterin-dependent oxidoreductase [Pyrofollis japonicus]BEP18640.1 molybdopterin-dependent oxidoreductase [Pyrofollis japonicus]
MSMQVSRREFLKIAGITAAAVSIPVGKNLAARNEKILALQSKKLGPVNVTYVPSICRMCTAQCSILVRVRNGRPERILGNPAAAPLNAGRICARGNAGLMKALSPDRIKKPLIRIAGSKRGEWKFQETGWEQAISIVTKKLRELKERGELAKKTIVIIGQIGCATYHPHIASFVKTLGIPNVISMPLTTCVMPKTIAWGMMGLAGKHSEIVPDYSRTRYFLSFGRNLGGSIAVGQTAKAGMNRRNYKLVVLEPRLSEWAAKADEWIPIKPGTDLAFLLAMINVIINEGLYDKEYLSKYTNAPMIITADGFSPVKTRKVKRSIAGKEVELIDFLVYDEATQSFTWVSEARMPALTLPDNARTFEGKRVRTVFEVLRNHVSQYTPEWASKITDVPVDTIRRIAREFATTKPATVETGWNTNRWWNSFQLYRAAGVLAALTGNLLRPGGVVLSAAGIKSVLNRAGPPVASPKSVLYPGEASLEITLSDGSKIKGPLLVFNAYRWPFEELQKEEGWVIIVIGANPARTFIADIFEKWASLSTVDLIVDIGITPDDTVAYSDVFIPECAYTERSYTITGAPFTTAKIVRAAFAAHKPPSDAECKNMLEILADIIAGVDESLLEKFAEMLAEEIGPSNCAEDFKKVIEEYMKTKGYDDLTSNIVKAQAKCMGIDYNRLRKDGAIVAAPEEWGLEMNKKILENGWLNSPTGKIEILPLKLLGLIKKKGLPIKPEWHPLPTWVPPRWMIVRKNLGSDEFVAITGKVPTMSYTSTEDNPLLALKLTTRDMNSVWVNTERARQLGIKDGDTIEVCSESGNCFRARAFVTDAIRPDTVFIPANYGNTKAPARFRDSHVPPLNKLNVFVVDPIAGSRIMADFIVRIRKA